MRRLSFLLALSPLFWVGGPQNTPGRAIVDEAISVAAAPVTIQPDQPTRTRVGVLDLVAGWRLTSPSSQFGGWSSLFVDGDRVTTVNDGGALLRFRLGRFGHPVDARVDALPAGCGQSADKKTRDSESLVHGPSGEWWVGYEWRHAICRLSPDFTEATALSTPAAMRGWPRTSGPEAMVRLADGRFLVFAEGRRIGGALRPLVVFAGDPTAGDVQATTVSYRPPAGYSPTDAVQLPDGRVFVLNRRLSVPALFTAVIVAIEPAQLDPARLAAGSTVEGMAVARFEPPVLSDNYEGLAVTVEGGWPFLWMISDDNQLSWQRTYLLKFAIDPPAIAEPPATIRRPAQGRPTSPPAEPVPPAAP